MEILRKNQREMLDIINTVIEMKDACDWLISRLNMIEGKKIFELVDISIETSKTEKQREQRQNKTKYPRNIGQLQKM